MVRRVRHGALAVTVCVALGCGAAIAKQVDATSDAIIGGDRSKTTRTVRSDAIIGGDRTSQLVVGQDPLSVYSRDVILAGPIVVRDDGISIFGRGFRLSPNQTHAPVSGTDQATGIVLGKSTDQVPLSAARLVVAGEPYVDGVSSVVVTGKVTAADARTATVHIGKVKIDYSALLAAGPLDLAVSDKIAVVGVRPSPESAIQATGIRVSR